MPTLQVAAAALNQTPLDWSGNRARIEKALAAACNAGVQFLVLPELAVSGYGCEDMLLAPHLQRRALDTAIQLSANTRGLMVNFGIPFFHDGRLYNCNLICCNGAPLGLVAKKHLDGSGIHYEPRWFAEWPIGVQQTVSVGGVSLPFGDVIFSLDGVRIGYEICHDAWVQRRHACDLLSRGVRLIANASASHFAFGKHSVVRELVSQGSLLCDGVYVYANLLGCEAGRAIYAGDRLIASRGTIIASGERFTYRDIELTTAAVEVPQADLATISPSTPAETPVQVAALSASSPMPSVAKPATPPWEQERELLIGTEKVSSIKYEEFARAVTLGLFDYLRKSRSQGFVVSLSGGTDSSATACLIRLMVAFALRDLGVAGLSAQLQQINGLPAALSVGAQFYELAVEPLVRGYTNIIEDATGRSFSWTTDDLTLQNIQSRARSPSIWMLANARRALLLSTGNRSEASVGYATMDGDTSGGLSPLGGIDKAFLRRWLVWLEGIGPSETGPMPALSLVTRQAPTAELRPPETRQTDEADLMPYELLDVIERLAIRDRLSPVEVWKKSCSLFEGRYTSVVLGRHVVQYFSMFAASQWKRERYAPAFHLDDLNLDPKTWCRFPILSGGFEAELDELKSALAK
ncbi:MAG: NAD(+) synthase [Proteobacteria bacterium]|nr:NAD(+) synthase [Pseudomonadota bacterium]